MILGRLELNEQQTMMFGINVFGTTQAPSDIRFVIENKDFDIVCRCKQVGEDLEVTVPPLKGVLEAGEYLSRIEVIIGDKIFTPVRESIEFNPAVEMDVTKKQIKIKNEGVEIRIKESSSKEIKQNPIDEILAEGYEIVEINGYQVIKKDDRYYGFVSDSKALRSPEGFSTLEKLVESLSNTK